MGSEAGPDLRLRFAFGLRRDTFARLFGRVPRARRRNEAVALPGFELTCLEDLLPHPVYAWRAGTDSRAEPPAVRGAPAAAGSSLQLAKERWRPEDDPVLTETARPLGDEHRLFSRIGKESPELAGFLQSCRTARLRIPCRRFQPFESPDRTTENRGVPGSSPGLAIRVATRSLASGVSSEASRRR
jgi:hypothetical protein